MEVWERLDVCHPTAVVILKPDHVRNTDLFVPRYNPRAFGPRLFFRDDVSETNQDPIEPGSHLPRVSSPCMMDGSQTDAVMVTGTAIPLFC